MQNSTAELNYNSGYPPSNIKFDTKIYEYWLVENSILSVEKLGNAWGKGDWPWGKDLTFPKPVENVLKYPHFFHKQKRLDRYTYQSLYHFFHIFHSPYYYYSLNLIKDRSRE
ncbi:hypothetical protein IQ260_00975 [Leptolyngbya cf. ectocarpi LEGE 11479]|uniref:Uncharacterized protein n=1 Tax=Leptolyngbya cf. ectocarpi LEGE 11479 TaxID=1828722 RepID=A0A928X0F0_LEPEC|nr:hypothetical protein [Leptolyngbya ectocarpi]MBE9065224.1 hypothetical protein [Leptolyngbya cf. ectocarpi LEGE 11479]